MTETIRRVVLVGAQGFVGAAVRQALTGVTVEALSATRLTTQARSAQELLEEAAGLTAEVAAVRSRLRPGDVVVNAAGLSDASLQDTAALFGANALWVALLGTVARDAEVARLVHVSSAVVQNDRPCLDESEDMEAFTPYSASKVAGEEVARALAASGLPVVRYRPPSVHAPGRRVTRRVARIAASPLASVSKPGDQPTPQALLQNVGSAVAFLATTPLEPPAVVAHPWEGLTTRELMRVLSGGKSPKRVPAPVARALVRAAKLAGRAHGPTAANARRVELLWCGQGQAESWLTQAGWRPPAGLDAWRELAIPSAGTSSRG